MNYCSAGGVTVSGVSCILNVGYLGVYHIYDVRLSGHRMLISVEKCRGGLVDMEVLEPVDDVFISSSFCSETIVASDGRPRSEGSSDSGYGHCVET